MVCAPILASFGNIRTLTLYFTTSYWKNAFSAWELLKGIMEGLGSIYVLVKLAGWLAKDLVTASQQYSGWLVLLTLLIALIWGLYRIRPRRVVSCTLANRDVTLAVEIGDLFSTDEALVIGTNRTFDTEISDHLISPLSAQGQFTAKYY